MKKVPYAHTAVVKGDASSLAVAAASIVAKFTRDKFMRDISAKYPRFGFDVHKGYGTAAHLQSLLLFGATDIHRPELPQKTPRGVRKNRNAGGTFLKFSGFLPV